MEVQRVNGSATRREAKEFWTMVQDNNVAKPPSRRIQEGTSCGSCSYYKTHRCTLKRKLVQPYNVCAEWKAK